MKVFFKTRKEAQQLAKTSSNYRWYDTTKKEGPKNPYNNFRWGVQKVA